MEYITSHISFSSENIMDFIIGILDCYFKGTQRYLLTRKVLIVTISPAEFNCMTLNSKLYQVVRYINGNTYWKRCYVLIKPLLPCLRVIRLDESNLAVTEKINYYFRTTKLYIQKSCFAFE